LQHHCYLPPGYVEGFCKHHNPFTAFLQLKYLHELKFILCFEFSPCRGNSFRVRSETVSSFCSPEAMTGIPIPVAHCLIGSAYSAPHSEGVCPPCGDACDCLDRRVLRRWCRIAFRRTDKVFNQHFRGLFPGESFPI